MVLQAEELCRAGEYAPADSLFREILSILNNGDGQNFQDSTIPIEQYMAEIVEFYSVVMPDTFAAPEVIASEVFQRQIFQSLDSLQLSPEDSMLVAGFINRSAAAYDIPMTWNSRVRRALLYYITRNKATVDVWKERSGTYLSFMKKMLADSGLPQDLAYLPLIESGFNPKAYSKAHASGIWQFIASTGRIYGLRSNYWIDERRDPVRSTAAAIQYLKKLYNDFGHWYLALAAYNCGEGGVSRTIEKQGSKDYWQLRLHVETMNYVPFYLAALVIAKSPDFSEATTSVSDTVPFDTVSVNDCIDMRDIAAATSVAFDTLKKLNPHILHWCTPPDMSSVLLYLPPGFAPTFTTFYASLPDEKKVKWYRYRVLPGDNLGSIARRFRLPVEGIRSVNRLRGTRIIAGKFLFIPIPVGASGYAISQEENNTAAAQASSTSDVPPGAKLTVYEVKPGDTVWRLSELFNVDAEQICAWNGLVDAHIKAGQVLSIYTVDTPTAGQPPLMRQPESNTASADGRHVVSQGENTFRIARQYSMQLDELCALNGLDPDAPVIHPGDTLLVSGSNVRRASAAQPRTRIPTQGSITYIVAAGDNLFRIARNFSTDVSRIRELNGLSESAALHCGDTLFVPQPLQLEGKKADRAIKEVVYYTVKSGDNLWRIASAFGIPVERLCEYNDLRSTSVLMPGDTLRVLWEGEM
ncbi:MAG: LysM peptidoglycan-binding domain-containing protein [Chitinispirillaceae bacterium]|nr:LysM peptidoglycan-binding domain-containing protein [Chitinispirillaceae bacterium]